MPNSIIYTYRTSGLVKLGYTILWNRITAPEKTTKTTTNKKEVGIQDSHEEVTFYTFAWEKVEDRRQYLTALIETMIYMYILRNVFGNL